VYTLLLADEFTLVRDGVALICRGSGRYRIAGECPDGLTAVKLILSLKPDMAVMDLNLPELHGTEVLRKVRQAGSETRFVFLSARRDLRSAQDALNAGAHGYLLKSDSAAQLLEALEQVAADRLYVSPRLASQEAYQETKRSAHGDALASLSVREHQVLSLLVDGVRPKQIANQLDLSLKTVDTYRSNLMKKLEIYDLPGLVKFAIQRNLTPL
jgi:DNA-binding NarL/FixJ family response regulator